MIYFAFMPIVFVVVLIASTADNIVQATERGKSDKTHGRVVNEKFHHIQFQVFINWQIQPGWYAQYHYLSCRQEQQWGEEEKKKKPKLVFVVISYCWMLYCFFLFMFSLNNSLEMCCISANRAKKLITISIYFFPVGNLFFSILNLWHIRSECMYQFRRF